ncbi:hypothetical protein RHM62_07815 [Actimicrobium sp. CCC2.4]|nr:hypothetical protein [Actimicrobium sp. CCC2.4]WPX33714.1 hypothetical protein RHM62_07815 [Actimicrobium sp. CCC2.4]
MRWTEFIRLLGCTAMAVTLAACGGRDNNDAPAQSQAAPPTAEAAIAQLENSGAIPKLDRSASLAGPDADGNGVRDDIDAYINGKFTDGKQRKAVLQDARAMQKAVLVDATDKVAAKTVSLRLMDSTSCLFSVFPDGAGLTSPESVSRKIEAITSNTKSRLKAYLAYNKSLDGSVGSLPIGDTCE